MRCFKRYVFKHVFYVFHACTERENSKLDSNEFLKNVENFNFSNKIHFIWTQKTPYLFITTKNVMPWTRLTLFKGQIFSSGEHIKWVKVKTLCMTLWILELEAGNKFFSYLEAVIKGEFGKKLKKTISKIVYFVFLVSRNKHSI